MSRAQTLVLHAAVLATAMSGAVFAWMKYGMRIDDPFAAENHPMQPWMLAMHVLAAPALVFAFGWIFNDHVLARFYGRTPNRPSGVAATLLFVLMAASGYLLQVITNDRGTVATRVGHWTTSAAFVLIYIIHVLRGRAIARATGRGA